MLDAGEVFRRTGSSFEILVVIEITEGQETLQVWAKKFQNLILLIKNLVVWQSLDFTERNQFFIVILLGRFLVEFGVAAS